MRLLCAVLFLSYFFVTGADAHRAALIIANSNYRNVSSLPNPINDAKLIAAILKRTGFADSDIALYQDLGYDQMRRALLAFKRQAAGAEVAVIYFAGHGFGGAENFLIPIDAEMRSWNELREEAWSQRAFEDAVSVASGLKLVILDACRNDPSRGRMSSVPSTRGIDRGLRSVEPEAGVLVAYSAKHGTVAQDGPAGGNSPFAAALAKHLVTPGEDIRFIFGGVRDEVLKVTASEQEPFLYGSLGHEHIYLIPPSGGPRETPTINQPSAPQLPAWPEAAIAWGVVQNTNSEAVLSEFISKFGDTPYGGFAKARLRELRLQRTSTTEPPRQPPLTLLSPPIPQTNCEGLLKKSSRSEAGSTIDCTRTTEPIEDLICADEDLAAWDHAMTEAYNQLLSRSLNQKQVRSSQVEWLKRRLYDCEIPAKGKWDICDLARAKPCILRLTRERTVQLRNH
jgi:uncharacterized protein YecT (DUF1311 family)